MAKVLFGNGVAGIRGSIAGNCYSANHYGAIIRNKTSPVQPRTIYQLNQRALFGSISANWRTLDPASQLSWQAIAPTFPLTDVFGNTQVLTGSALYQQVNNNLSQAGQSMLDIPASPAGFPTFEITGRADAATPAISVTISGYIAGDYTGFSFLVYATPCVSPGKQYVKNLYKFLGTFIPTVGTGQIGFNAEWSARFGGLISGNSCFVLVSLINIATGQRSTPVTINLLVA